MASHLNIERILRPASRPVAVPRLLATNFRCTGPTHYVAGPLVSRVEQRKLLAEVKFGVSRLPFPGSKNVACQAASANAAETQEPGMADTLVLGALFGLWYLANIYFNIYNKQVLKAFAHPFTVTAIQFAVGGVLALSSWALGIVKRPVLTKSTIASILPLALVHTLGNLLTNVSLGAVAVSFTHTIKAMEPFFSVLLSALFLGETPSIPVVLTLLPIVGGVAMASVSEASFNWTGFLSAMGSNVTFQSRNVLSKKLMVKKGGLDNINLFSIITILSFFLLTPVSIAVDGLAFLPSAMTAVGIADVNVVMQRALMAALCFHGYQQVSYMILQRVSPVTHSVGNCVKRVVVIVASVVVFKNPMSTQNAIGTTLALGGVFLYSQIKRLTGKGKAKAE